MIICFVVLGIQLQTFVLQENIPALSLLWLLLAATGSQSLPLFISRVLMMLLDADNAPCRLAIHFSFLMLGMRVWFTGERAHHSTVSAIHTTYRCACDISLSSASVFQTTSCREVILCSEY